jgi:hypothetical protein
MDSYDDYSIKLKYYDSLIDNIFLGINIWCFKINITMFEKNIKKIVSRRYVINEDTTTIKNLLFKEDDNDKINIVHLIVKFDDLLERCIQRNVFKILDIGVFT